MAEKKSAPKNKKTKNETSVVAKTKVTPESSDKEPRKFNLTDMIPCTSVCFGVLQYTSPKTGMSYVWADSGDIQEVQYSDLLAMKASHSRFLFEPWIVIDDEELYEQWKRDLGDIYEMLGELSDIRGILTDKTATQIKAIIDKSPVGFQETIKNTAAALIREGLLDSIAKVRVLDEALNTDLKSLF